jgi:hypothetical protein
MSAISLIQESINEASEHKQPIGNLSDGYHTFDELYAHRIALFSALCKGMNTLCRGYCMAPMTWKSKLHSDGSSMEGWFIAGIDNELGKQITYHIPMSYWEDWPADEIEKAPEWDGHTSADVLKRLSEL